MLLVKHIPIRFIIHFQTERPALEPVADTTPSAAAQYRMRGPKEVMQYSFYTSH